MANDFEIDVSPEMSLYRVLASENFNVSYALAEFIDNALQAHLTASSSNTYYKNKIIDVKIRIYSDSFHDSKKRNSIEIEDDGPGIARVVLETGMKLGGSNPQIQPNSLGGFGIGMKSAAIRFSDSWQVQTQPCDKQITYSFSFDLNQLLQDNKEKVLVTEKDTSTDRQKHRTIIILKNIRRTINKENRSKIESDLTEIYQRFTASNHPNCKKQMTLSLFFDGMLFDLNATYNLPKILNAPEFDRKNMPTGKKNREWKEEVKFQFQNNIIKGFLIVRDKGSYKDNPGLCFFRNNRLILGLKTNPHVPESIFDTKNKYAAFRIYGEFDIGQLPISWKKDGLDLHKDDFLDKIKSIPEVKNLLNQAVRYRVGSKKSKPPKPPTPPKPKDEVVKILEQIQPNSLILKEIITEMIELYQQKPLSIIHALSSCYS